MAKRRSLEAQHSRIDGVRDLEGNGSLLDVHERLLGVHGFVESPCGLKDSLWTSILPPA